MPTASLLQMLAWRNGFLQDGAHRGEERAEEDFDVGRALHLRQRMEGVNLLLGLLLGVVF